MSVLVKICGLSTPEAVAAAVDHGAGMAGFVFYPPSPRHVTAEQAAELIEPMPSGVDRVGLFVDADDATIESVLNHAALDLLQLHGAETPERVQEVKRRFRRPVIKAIKLQGPEDLAEADRYDGIADWLLFDAKAPKDLPGALPGGNGLVFDWELLRGRRFRRPWLLSGGLDADNLAEAVRISGAPAVDVSSGVESAPGRKDVLKILAFLHVAARL
ncbi:MAG: phosphoribosylanthranilate isomerase [Alphaproteobacteria bacterium]|nr:phosphoribosylanthranilate isomerase [Alphaproteobacteria bacterium]